MRTKPKRKKNKYRVIIFELDRQNTLDSMISKLSESSVSITKQTPSEEYF